MDNPKTIDTNNGVSIPGAINRTPFMPAMSKDVATLTISVDIEDIDKLLSIKNTAREILKDTSNKSIRMITQES